MTSGLVNAYIAAAFSIAVLLLFLVVILKVYSGAIDIQTLIAEPDGKKASLSRFQWLVFLFVIAGLYSVLCVQANTFIEIPPSVLGLLGISTGGFLVSKNLSNSATATAAGTQTQQTDGAKDGTK